MNLVLTGAFILLVQWPVAAEGPQARADFISGTEALHANRVDRFAE